MNQTHNKSLSVWFIRDQRPGHISQLEGLADRLAAHHSIEAHWLDVKMLPYEWTHGLLKGAPKLDIQTPDVIVGAGHQTHKPLLIASRLYKAFSVVLMKPSLPHNWFNAIISPNHDGLEESKRILNTFGAINKINPVSTSTAVSKKSKLMLIGGPSKHFSWNDESIIKQIVKVCSAKPDLDWLLSDSPRTPEIFIDKLSDLKIPNLDYHSYLSNQDIANQNDWLSKTLMKCDITWVTPDSVSMIYESLTAKNKTALFDLPMTKKRKSSKVARSIRQLIAKQHVTSFKQWQQSQDYFELEDPVWEADRAAIWLLERLQSKNS